jgi:hypothetical protein
MNSELAELLIEWHGQTPFSTDADWVFASPFYQRRQAILA